MKKRILASIVSSVVSITALLAQENTAFLNPPEVVFSPASHYKYSSDSRKFTGIPSLAITANGTMWATWYAGRTAAEDANNYVVLAKSTDQGNSWEEILVVDPDGGGPVRAYDPEIWVDPDDRVWLFWAQAIGHNGTVAGVWSMQSKADKKGDAENWSAPRRLTDGIMMCKPTILSNGDWLLPVSTWRLTDESAKVVASTDKGKTWTVRGACNVPKEDRNYDEHMIVERKNGFLWMLVRTRYGMAESTSRDQGRTWADLQPSSIKHTPSRFFITKLSSGNLLLVKHGPINVNTKRSHLMAFISGDDGKTWSNGLLLDERLGVSYPDGQQTADGRISIIYDFSRTREQEILMTSFTEEDIVSKDYDEKIIDAFNNRKLISKGGRH